ncbi:hypothetical protein DM02DRAFT_208651 [Periconia macrospinosa]|uniref:Uncharacterized protein n=1 Tax=Periconia macrospinosa TaxID=97972 RepID=A0A2V1E2X8_9PLEO|nr:hypothetical protein DM02DRAFT_208651 [Periconia macrospinosa]
MFDPPKRMAEGRWGPFPYLHPTCTRPPLILFPQQWLQFSPTSIHIHEPVIFTAYATMTAYNHSSINKANHILPSCHSKKQSIGETAWYDRSDIARSGAITNRYADAERTHTLSFTLSATELCYQQVPGNSCHCASDNYSLRILDESSNGVIPPTYRLYTSQRATRTFAHRYADTLNERKRSGC